jgi:hypothetical protein
MEPYSEKELIEFTNFCLINRKINNLMIDQGVTDTTLQNWKETLKQKRREQKINDILNGN